jgi:hypothetical protein
MGETAEFSVSKKEGIDQGLLELDPDFHLKWSDCAIGKASSISLSASQDNTFETLCNLVSHRASQTYRALAEAGLGGGLKERVSLKLSSFSMKFQR